tara:strand:- start:536 stop:970 length:435 start_codon:yes stop_codon:yes gene_type:complete
MSIPHTFGDKSGSVLLGDLDYNFTILDTRLGVVESTAVTQTSLTTSLSLYATTDAVTASLSSYATTASLSSYATTASLSDKADLTGANFTGNVDVTGTISLGGNWTIVETNGTLYFKNSGVSKVKITSDGAITSVNNVTAYGTI